MGVAAERPVTITYIVPGPVSIVALAGQLYGPDGLGRMDEILTQNLLATPIKPCNPRRPGRAGRARNAATFLS